jgi:hypothetical protein
VFEHFETPGKTGPEEDIFTVIDIFPIYQVPRRKVHIDKEAPQGDFPFSSSSLSPAAFAIARMSIIDLQY